MSHKAIIMAAPNGARKTHADHPALPVSIDETVAEAVRCFDAGATVLHAHVRSDAAEHVLDAERYRLLISRLTAAVPDLHIQVTTEAVGRYSALEQADCVHAVKPNMISMAVREMAGEGGDLDHAREFYDWCHRNDTHVQHIVYDTADLERLFTLHRDGVVPGARLCVLYVLGRYAADQQSTPGDIDSFVEMAARYRGQVSQYDWFVCAFGRQEQACAVRAVALGGHARIGFENNLLDAEGNPASSNAAQVAALVDALEGQGIAVADSVEAAGILGLRRGGS